MGGGGEVGAPVSERSPTGSCAKAHRWQQQEEEEEIKRKERVHQTKGLLGKGTVFCQETMLKRLSEEV